VTAEAGEGREAHGGKDAVAVHVADALVDVVRPRTHLGEPNGVEAPLLFRPGDDGIETHGAHLLAFEHPLLDAVVTHHDVGCPVLVFGWYVPVEHVGRLDNVVVDAHQDQFVDVQLPVDRALGQTAIRNPTHVPSIRSLSRDGRSPTAAQPRYRRQHSVHTTARATGRPCVCCTQERRHQTEPKFCQFG
jgi:hypothetical protein